MMKPSGTARGAAILVRILYPQERNVTDDPKCLESDFSFIWGWGEGVQINTLWSVRPFKGD